MHSQELAYQVRFDGEILAADDRRQAIDMAKDLSLKSQKKAVVFDTQEIEHWEFEEGALQNYVYRDRAPSGRRGRAHD